MHHLCKEDRDTEKVAPQFEVRQAKSPQVQEAFASAAKIALLARLCSIGGATHPAYEKAIWLTRLGILPLRARA